MLEAELSTELGYERYDKKDKYIQKNSKETYQELKKK
jgi:hypothetical protein